MSKDLHRLTYFSRNLIPVEVDSQIAEILEASRRNNVDVGVTGALMFNRSGFAQVLEGDLDKVQATFDRIKQDDRHEVYMLELKPVQARGFPNWSMGYVGRSQADAYVYDQIASDSGFDPAAVSGERVFEALRALLIAQELAAA